MRKHVVKKGFIPVAAAIATIALAAMASPAAPARSAALSSGGGASTNAAPASLTRADLTQAASAGLGNSADWASRPIGGKARASRFDQRVLGAAQLTLPQAIATAEKADGGPALDGFLADRQGKPVYQIQVLQHGNVIATVCVDAMTGMVTQYGALPALRWTALERQEVANLGAAKLDLGRSIAIAEHGRRGKAVSATVSHLRNFAGFAIDLVDHDSVHRLVVRPAHPQQAVNSGKKTG